MMMEPLLTLSSDFSALQVQLLLRLLPPGDLPQLLPALQVQMAHCSRTSLQLTNA